MITGEYYHVYNRGAHKAPIFLDGNDYTRFLQLLYVKNHDKKFRFNVKNTLGIFTFKQESKLVDIISYCLMPNHYHLVLRERVPGGISKFMQKLGTSYVMYFNNKYDHSGTIFQGSYKHNHVDSDRYFNYLNQYIHLNPFGIITPHMNKRARTEYYKEAVVYSRKYEYSSFRDYLGEKRLQTSILSNWNIDRRLKYL